MKNKRIIIPLFLILILCVSPFSLVGRDYLAIRIDYDTNDNPEYIGFAEAGTAPTQAKWIIMKLTFDANDNCTAIQFAEGKVEFAYVWNRRGSYSYK